MWRWSVLSVLGGLIVVLNASLATAAEGFVETFKASHPDGWHVANYEFSHPHFDTDWSLDQIHLNNGAHLYLSPKSTGKNRFEGASIRRETPTHFGRYEVVMQPARRDGVITGFFTYTGAYYGTRHDEIDIEFLGKDTTRLHAAWFVDGVLTNHFIDLGFDAATKPRLYAFEWLPDRIRWFVEDQMVFEITQQEADLPSEPSFLFANIWAADPSLDAWSGTPSVETRANAFIGAIRFIPMADNYDFTS
ncbi:family 16 glycosylhydrolase [Shimia sp. Alg240-R146]|uniref:family 16 glycosylhydrolase n=1 Tax=Shimia sp. Alg240-R146 TaxID=2993449 RepID=UPI0022E5CDB9|nr:family 16 glycosylhydrolase [Shimia sp. Alg240-R146]